MNKSEFLEKLRLKLSGLPEQDIKERLCFYNEIIEDKIEEGYSEEQAVESVGTIEQILIETVSDIPLTRLAKEKVRNNRRLKAWEITIIALGSPIWFSLAFALFAVIFALYISFWSIIISLWSVFVSFAVGSVASVILSVTLALTGKNIISLASISAGFILAGLAILCFFCCKAVTKGAILLSKKILLCIKKFFIKKEIVNE